MHGRLSASELNMRARRQFTDSKSSKPTQQSTFTGSVDVSGYVNELSGVSRVLRPHQHIIGHFEDESFQSITCTGTDNLTRTTKRQNT